MGLIELKENLHKLIDKVSNESVLKAHHELLIRELEHENEGDSVELSEMHIAAINKGASQIKNGEFYTHEEVMSKLKTKYPQLHTK